MTRRELDSVDKSIVTPSVESCKALCRALDDCFTFVFSADWHLCFRLEELHKKYDATKALSKATQNRRLNTTFLNWHVGAAELFERDRRQQLLHERNSGARYVHEHRAHDERGADSEHTKCVALFIRGLLLDELVYYLHLVALGLNVEVSHANRTAIFFSVDDILAFGALFQQPCPAQLFDGGEQGLTMLPVVLI